MSWSYDPTNLTTTTTAGQINSVRLLIGDVDTADQQVQNEEITFALDQNRSNIYLAGAMLCGILAAKYSREADFSLGNGALSEDSSNKAKAYIKLQTSLRSQATRSGVLPLSVTLGISYSDLQDPEFTMDQFDIDVETSE